MDERKMEEQKEKSKRGEQRGFCLALFVVVCLLLALPKLPG